MNTAHLLLGTNLGDRVKNLETACIELEKKAGIILKKSSLYQTSAWGNTHQPDFYNQCILIETTHSPDDLLRELLQVEKKLGRVRTDKWEARIMDIDILFYDDRVISGDKLVIPHPMLHLRKFTLMPLEELDPSLFHPLLKKTVSRLLSECPDKLEVKKIKPANIT